MYMHTKRNVETLGFCSWNIFSEMGWRKFPGLRLLQSMDFSKRICIPGCERETFFETPNFFMQEIGTQMAKNADKPSMFLEVSERCFQHALDSINVCGKAGPCLWHVWFFYTKLWFKDASNFKIVGVACWD